MDNKKSEAYHKMMTESSVKKLIIKYCIPTILTMLVTNVYNIVDTAFVGKLGNSASGAVGIVFGFMSIIQAIGFLFGQGSGSILSRKLGRRDVESASKTASTGFFLSFTLGLIVSVICMIYLDPLVYFLGSTETIAPYAHKYIFYILLTAPFIVASFTLNNILRYEGKAVFGMIGMFSGAVLNIGGDALFMFKLNMGISGAGLSTAIAQVISFIILLIPFLRGQTQCKISIKRVDLSIKHLFNIVATGFPSLLRQGLNSIATILLNSLAGGYGDEAVAAMSIVSRVFFFIFAIALGVGQGFQPVSGYNYGAGKYKRVKDAYRFTVIFSTLLVSGIAVAAYIKADSLIYLFREDATVVSYGTRALRLHLISGIVMPFCMSTEMLLQSTGKKLAASLVSALRSGIVFIPCLEILAHLRGMSGIQEAQPLAFVISAIPTFIFAHHYIKQMSAKEEVQSDTAETDH